jgi:hypothetical protein
MFGVWVSLSQQPPPGWLTSASPSPSTVTSSDWPTSVPARKTLNDSAAPGA